MSRLKNGDHQYKDDDDDIIRKMNEDLERLEKILRTKKQIVALQAELKALEENHEQFETFNWDDIKHLIQCFTGDDNIKISTFVMEFDEAANRFGWSETKQYVYAKRAIGGTAAAFLRIVPANNWCEIRKELIEEFSTTVLNSEVHKELSDSNIQVGETMHQYMIRMRTIAAQGVIDEQDLVHYIVEGLMLDNIGKMFFLSANTLKELRNISEKYISIKGNTTKYIEERPSKTHRPLRCYKCNGLDHLVSTCSFFRSYPGKNDRCVDFANHCDFGWNTNLSVLSEGNASTIYQSTPHNDHHDSIGHEFQNGKSNLDSSKIGWRSKLFKMPCSAKNCQAGSVVRKEHNVYQPDSQENMSSKILQYDYQNHRAQNSEEVLENWRLPQCLSNRIYREATSNFRQRA